jgi:hypothetical protein
VDVLGICDRIVDDYRKFVGGFVVQDALIREHVGKRLADGYQWSAPWLSLSRSFASGSAVGDVVGAGLLQPEA